MGEAGEAGGGKGGGETMSSMRLSVLAPAIYHPMSRYLSPLGVEHAPLPTYCCAPLHELLTAYELRLTPQVLASLKAACADEGLEACADEGTASLI